MYNVPESGEAGGPSGRLTGQGSHFGTGTVGNDSKDAGMKFGFCHPDRIDSVLPGIDIRAESRQIRPLRRQS